MNNSSQNKAGNSTKSKVRKTPKILLVDDTSANLRTYRLILQQHGFDVETAENGEQAVLLAKKIIPDLILLDVAMPGMDGYETCEAIKSNERLSEVPIIFLTSLDETRDKLRGFMSGAVDYVAKTFDAAELIARIRTHLELKRASDQIAQQANDLRIMNEEKSALMNMVAHDMRNPLANINLSITLIKKLRDSLSKEQILDKLFEIEELSNRMSSITDRLLKLNELESITRKIAKQSVDISSVVQRIAKDYRQQASEKKISVKLEIPAGIQILADEQYVESIVDNIISNAVKFTLPSGEILIQVSKLARVVRLSVTDSGPGISDEDFPKLFTKFAKLSAKPTAGEPTLGLGLAITKRTAEAIGAKISVKSVYQNGATFIVEFAAAR